MAAAKNKPAQNAGIGAIVNPIEGNTDLSDRIYIATKGISHNGKLFTKGKSVEGIEGKDLDRLIRLGAVIEKNDGFPRLN